MSITVASAQAHPVTSSSTPSIMISKAGNANKTPAYATTKAPNRTLNGDHNHVKAAETDPLPADLRQILTEVACTGKCPWLSWNGKDAPQAPMPLEVQPAKGGSISSSSTSRSVFAKHSSSAFSSFPPKSAVRKKHRNGVHVNRLRFTKNGTGNASGRKRPLYLTRTLQASGSTFSASSIGSARTSGSEVDDSTQYECDSEGTSATSNSELSVERRVRQRVTVQTTPAAAPEASLGRYKTLRGALRKALVLVLDHSYRYRGGYKLSPAELRINAAAVAAQETTAGDTKIDVAPPSPEKAFLQRRRRLLALLGQDSESSEAETKSQSECVADGDSVLSHHALTGHSYLGNNAGGLDGPPFTIQRIAEVLVVPERYYKQTHKLCNCLEKLLLITSPASAFGGSMGGDASPNREEDTEPGAMSDKRGRQEVEPRNKRLRRRLSSSSDDHSDDEKSSQHANSLKQERSGDDALGRKQTDDSSEHKGESRESHMGHHEGSEERSSREMIETAARASLRSKFDHVGIDPHSPSAVVRSSSPPLPSLSLVSAASAMAHGPGFVQSDSDSLSQYIGQNPLPFFSSQNESGTPIQPLHANHSIHLLQMHHVAALGGVPMSSSPFDFMINAAANGTIGPVPASDAADLEAEPGRSSASNSDIDSESDDVSLDDYASDRSDGSDSGGHFEPFTAARVMALNRIQQQQRLQNRAIPGYNYGDGFRPPPDFEYQSGDSIDSTMAEDSCGSDSSSTSDLAD